MSIMLGDKQVPRRRLAPARGVANTCMEVLTVDHPTDDASAMHELHAEWSDRIDAVTALAAATLADVERVLAMLDGRLA